MGFRSTSTRRTSAASAVSSQSVVVNTSTGLAAVGATIKSNTSISLGVTTVGQTSAATTTTVSAGPTIGNIQYLDANNQPYSDDIAVSTTGGNILINGSGFTANSSVYVNNTLVSNTFISSTQVRAILPAAGVGNVTLMMFTPTNTGVIAPNAIRYSGFPTWTTAAVSVQNNIAANVALVATGDSTLTYTLQAGSSLPTGLSLSDAGYVTGTATGYPSSTSVSAVIIVTDLEGQATQQTINFTVTSGDDRFPYTTLLLNGETSVTPFHADASSNSFGLTLAGDVRADDFSPYYGDGYYSNYFNGSTDYFTAPSNAGFQFGTGDFTIECWLLIAGAGDNRYQHIVQSRDGTNNGFLVQYDRTNGTIELTSDTGFTGAISASSAIVDNTWYHFAATRSGTSVKIFLNGTQVGSTVTSAQNLTATGPVYVSRRWVTDGALHYVNGYISNLRIVKGTALYTANFTPSTSPLTAVSGTQLLTCQSNRLIDKSANALTLTVAGTPKVSPAIPFAASSTYASYGSMYVPTAVTNYLALAHTAATTITSGSTDSFIAECWVYFNSATASTAIMDQSGVTGSTFENWSLSLDASKKFRIIWGATGAPGSQTGVLSGTTVAASGVWYHIAYVKTNADWALFVNGVRETSFNGLNTASDGTSNPLRIGSDTFSGQSINGYIADVRVYKGATAGAPYSATSSTITAPSAPLTAVTNTQLLTCQYNGGANNSGIVDNGPFNNVVTRVGNTSQGTFSPYSPTGWSNYFNGSADYITVPATATAFGASNWTIEGWVYVTSFATAIVLFDTRSGTSPNNGVQCTIGTDGSVVWFEGSASTIATAAAGSITLNTWYHIAFVRSGTGTNQCTVYVNGVSKITGTSSLNHGGFTTYIGRNAAAAQNYFPGYISNFRVVNGTAVYSGAFTPSATPLTAITNTSLLTCQSNRIKDNSTNNGVLTTAGTPSVQAYSPFSPSAAYTPSLHGGSAYFDGTGDNITVGTVPVTLPTATTPFTMEAWVYVTAFTGISIISTNYSTGAVPFMLGLNGGTNATTTTGGYPVMYHYSGSAWTYAVQSTSANSTALKLNQWYHIAGVYTGSAATIYVNGTATVTAAVSTWTTTASAAGGINVGRKWDTSTGAYFSGYISDARVVVGTAVYTSNFTPPTAPLAPISNTNFLCNFTNGGITDKHSSYVLETVGGAQVSTAVKKYGNASMQFSGSQSLLFPGSSIPSGAGSAFTVEFWINAPSYNTLTILRANGNASSLGLSTNSSGQLIVSNTFAADLYTSTSTLSPNVWTHVAIVRTSANLYTIYFNGTSAGTAVTYATSLGIATQMYIGYNTYNGAYSTFYLDDFRVTQGFARYTANFTPPTSAMLGQ